MRPRMALLDGGPVGTKDGGLERLRRLLSPACVDEERRIEAALVRGAGRLDRLGASRGRGKVAGGSDEDLAVIAYGKDFAAEDVVSEGQQAIARELDDGRVRLVERVMSGVVDQVLHAGVPRSERVLDDGREGRASGID